MIVDTSATIMFTDFNWKIALALSLDELIVSIAKTAFYPGEPRLFSCVVKEKLNHDVALKMQPGDGDSALMQ